MLEQQDEGYEDDGFEGTPFRDRKFESKKRTSQVHVKYTPFIFKCNGSVVNTRYNANRFEYFYCE